jgi:sigma-B regulation protein RsbQ
MKTIERDHVKIDYGVTGNSDTTLLFVHGAFIDKDYWDAQVKYFSPNYKVVTVDLAGHGKSGKNRTDWSIQALGEDIVTVIEELNLSNVILIGHSFGGYVILEAANRIPQAIRGLVGIDNFKNAGGETTEEIQTQIDWILEQLKSDFPNTSELFVRQVLVTPSTNSTISDRIVKDFRSFDPMIGVQILNSSFTYYKRERELLQQLKLRLYLINVDYTPTNEDLLKKYVQSGYEISQLHGSCHYPMIEKPEEFNHLLQEIILKA